MLKIKDEVNTNSPIVIFVAKSRGRRITFDAAKVSPEDYPKWKMLGFNIFRCTSCGTDTCFGDCGTTAKDISDALESMEIELSVDLGSTDGDSSVTAEITIDPVISTTEPMVVDLEVVNDLILAEPLKVKIEMVEEVVEDKVEVVDFKKLNWNDLRAYASKLFDIQGMKKAEIISKLESK